LGEHSEEHNLFTSGLTTLYFVKARPSGEGQDQDHGRTFKHDIEFRYDIGY